MSYSNANVPNMWPTATSPAFSPNAAPSPMYTSPAYMGPNAPPMYTSPAYMGASPSCGCTTIVATSPAHHAHHPHHYGTGFYNAGIILVLFILLVIITRSWAI